MQFRLHAASRLLDKKVPSIIGGPWLTLLFHALDRLSNTIWLTNTKVFLRYTGSCKICLSENNAQLEVGPELRVWQIMSVMAKTCG